MSLPTPTRAPTILADPGRRRFAGLMLAGLAMALGGCGRKPGKVDPADDAAPEASLYPRQYPNLNFDPPKTVEPNRAVVPEAPAAAADTALQTEKKPLELPNQPAYPKFLRPEDLTPNAVLGNTGTWTSQ